MQLLLINPFIRKELYHVFPLGIGYIAGAARAAGHTVTVLDINALALSEEEVIERIKNIAYDAVGIGGMVTNYGYVKKLAGILKLLHPDRPLVLGGALTAGIGELLLKKTMADIVVEGEAEETIVELLAAFAARTGLKNIRGIYYKARDTIVRTAERTAVPDVARLPEIPYELFPMDRYLLPRSINVHENSPAFDILASRGCPFQCGFCSRMIGQKVRFRPIKHIIGDIKRYKERFNVQHFWFLDESFTLNRKWVEELCAALITTQPGISFSCSTRVDLVDRELLPLLKRAGCLSISFGVESYNQAVLTRMKKGITRDQIDTAIQLCKEAGIVQCVTFMLGYPGETRKSIFDTVKFVYDFSRGFNADYFIPLPGSEIYNEMRAQGKIPDEDKHLENLPMDFSSFYINVTELSDRELISFPWLVFYGVQKIMESR